MRQSRDQKPYQDCEESRIGVVVDAKLPRLVRRTLPLLLLLRRRRWAVSDTVSSLWLLLLLLRLRRVVVEPQERRVARRALLRCG